MWDLIVSVPDHCLSFYLIIGWLGGGKLLRYSLFSITSHCYILNKKKKKKKNEKEKKKKKEENIAYLLSYISAKEHYFQILLRISGPLHRHQTSKCTNFFPISISCYRVIPFRLTNTINNQKCLIFSHGRTWLITRF